MSEKYVAFGEVIAGALPGSLSIPEARKTWDALIPRREFTIIEVRRHNSGHRYAEILVVDCENDSVPTRNPVGIEYRERLGLLFYSQPDIIPEVRALRVGFPATLHQYHVPKGEPANLCLYFEPWTAIRSTWTPQKHLSRILWWLAETANGTLHRADQPPEQLYFQSPFELILPYDFDEKVANKDFKLVMQGRKRSENKFTLVGAMYPLNMEMNNAWEFPCIALSLPPIVHGPIEDFPHTLGGLHDQLGKRGASFARPLFDTILGLTQSGTFTKPKSPETLIILCVPLVREMGSTVERIVVKGFIVHANIADIGVASGALHKVDNAYLAVNLVGVEIKESQGWRDFTIAPLEIVRSFTPELARQTCGIKDKGPTGTLVGVGSLGSEMFNLWTRSGWGRWTLIDSDHIKPHNLARHSALECHVGFYKVNVVKGLADKLIPQQPSKTVAVAEHATNLESAKVKTALELAEIVVDATTTLDFPRAIAACDSVKRAVSVFVTPSGCGAIMIVEDATRTIRLDALEAQYYRLVISQPWGKEHLTGHYGHLWTGGGCRDVSMVLPNELLAVHGANLASMVRIRTAAPEASLHIWDYDSATGSIVANIYKAVVPRMAKINDLQIVWDEEIREKVHLQREKHLPNETGGVLLGYFDLVLHKVFIVDALAAPPDSRGDPTGFVRGIDGLEDAVKEAGQRTANVVGYVGEWHSHPRQSSADPSGADIVLLAHLATALEYEGLLALMLIVGEHEDNWLTGRVV
jgi:integrative and conjugative element protein (TIGR02256 family)